MEEQRGLFVRAAAGVYNAEVETEEEVGGYYEDRGKTTKALGLVNYGAELSAYIRRLTSAHFVSFISFSVTGLRKVSFIVSKSVCGASFSVGNDILPVAVLSPIRRCSNLTTFSESAMLYCSVYSLLCLKMCALRWNVMRRANREVR